MGGRRLWNDTCAGVFDAPTVEALAPNSNEPEWSLDLVAAEFVTAMAVVEQTLLVLQSRHVVFVDLDSGEATIVDLGGDTRTRWVGR